MPSRVARREDRRSWDEILDGLTASWQVESAERKQDRSRRREAEILQAALRVFARQGIARARIADVAAEAGMPVSSIYEYHASKEDLAYAVPVAQLGQFFLEYAKHARDVPTQRERLRLYLWLSADFARRNPDWARTLYLEVWPSVLVLEARVRKGLDEYANFIVDLIRAGERAGEWEAGPDPYQTATILVGSINQLIITWLMYRRPRNISRGAESLVDRLLSSLLPPLGDTTPPPGSSRSGTAKRPRGSVLPSTRAPRRLHQPVGPTGETAGLSGSDREK
ncbi:TetR/AcrR family transcriptional regulator [Enterovirga aerilata]|uniref:TetR/AcrR family transcriptional regulator n=1 Tax=Enterovirga aerilata TaxID=2730920 RepID=A0A849ICI1_9HYPH|nr:TetR/AcrR family transcriptional regulator [Enterovirga sp. DB1703]NNM74129.1 TetR/AcrR family transcriptional regulator [Enterovirga sp. DB1703]